MLAQKFSLKFLEKMRAMKNFAVIKREILLVYHLLKSQFYYLFYDFHDTIIILKIKLPTPEFTDYRAKRERNFPLNIKKSCRKLLNSEDF